MYNLITSWLVSQALPPALRKPRLKAWLRSLVRPVQTLNNWFAAEAEHSVNEVNRNGQTLVLEAALNSHFLTTGIYISHPSNGLQPLYIFFHHENQPPLYIFYDSEGQPPVYIFYESDFEQEWDFIVNVPAAAGLDLNAVRSFVRKYSIAGVNFNVIEI